MDDLYYLAWQFVSSENIFKSEFRQCPKTWNFTLHANVVTKDLTKGKKNICLTSKIGKVRVHTKKKQMGNCDNWGDCHI